MKRLNKVLHSCSVFDKIPEEKYPNILHCLQATKKEFKKDEAILNIGETSQMAGIILSGIVELAFFDENGNQVSVNHINAGDVFGAERACCDQSTSPIRLRAVTNASVLFLNFGNLLKIEGNVCPYRSQVTVNLLQDFARQTQFLNLKLRIMGQKHLRDKLKIYFQTLHIGPEGYFTIPYNRRELAEFLYVDRSALSRELCRMRNEKILNFDGNIFHILDWSFLE